MFSLLGGIVAAAATTALGAFSEGVLTTIVSVAVLKSTGKANISLKK